jgi:hypothetical protein
MPVAKSKPELLDSMQSEFRLLKETVAGLSDRQMTAPGVCHRWSAKDVLAHLVEWERMFFGWYQAGLRGGKPKTPADDLKWNQLPALNERIYQKWEDVPLAAVLRDLDGSYKRILKLTKDLPENRLFQRGLYSWMGAWPLSRWIAADSASHYRWARTRIRRWRNQSARPPAKRPSKAATGSSPPASGRRGARDSPGTGATARPEKPT